MAPAFGTGRRQFMLEQQETVSNLRTSTLDGFSTPSAENGATSDLTPSHSVLRALSDLVDRLKPGNRPGFEPSTPEEQIIDQWFGATPASSPHAPGSSKVLEQNTSPTPKRAEINQFANYNPPSERDIHIKSLKEPAHKALTLTMPVDSTHGPKGNTTAVEFEGICAFCDMKLDVKFLEEPIKQMSCGHSAHQECYNRLMAVASEYGDDLPTCAICDGHISATGETYSAEKSPVRPLFEGKSKEIRSLSSASTHSTRNVLKRMELESPFSTSDEAARWYQASRSSKAQMPLFFDSAEGITEDRSLGLSTFGGLELLKQSGPTSAPDCSPFHGKSLPQRPSTSSSRSIQSKKSFSKSSPRPLHPAALSSSSSCEALVSPESPTSGSHKPQLGESQITEELDPPCLSFNYELSNLLDNDSAESLPLGSPDQSLKLITAMEKISDDEFTVMVAIKASRLSAVTRKAYESSVEDVQYGLDIHNKVYELAKDGKYVSGKDFGALRLHTKGRVTSPDRKNIDWANADLYLFENVLIIVWNGRVKAVFDANSGISDATKIPYKLGVMCLRFCHEALPRLLVHSGSSTTVEMWKQAVADPSAQFPLSPVPGPISNPGSAEDVPFERGVYGNSPVEIVLCLPYRGASTSMLCFQQCVHAALRKLSYRDKLAIIVYSKNSIIQTTTLRGAKWKHWSGIFDELHERNECAPLVPGTHRGGYNLDGVLEEAANVLESHNTTTSTASIVLVSDDDTYLRGVPLLFESSGTKIHTIGMSECHGAASLNTLSRLTAGSYHYVKTADQLTTVVGSVVGRETRYMLKEVCVRMKPRLGSTIVVTEGGASCPFIDIFGQHASVTREGAVLDEDGRSWRWCIGHMREGEPKCILLRLKGLIPEGLPALQLYFEGTDTLGSPGSLSSSSTRVTASPLQAAAEDIELIRIYEALVHTSVSLDKAAALLLMDSHRSAFQMVMECLETLRAEPMSTSIQRKSFKLLLKGITQFLDGICDAIIERRLLTREFMLGILQKTWLLSSKLAFLRRDSLENAFYYC